MKEDLLKQADDRLKRLKQKTDDKIWQYAILKEFVALFGENKRVLQFIFANFGAGHYGIIDDSVLLSEEELNACEENKEMSPEESMRLLFDRL